MDGDLVDAIETVSEHLITTHVHDNGGRTDDHLVPFDGTIDWPAALTAVQKVGYDGHAACSRSPRTGSPKETLAAGAPGTRSGWNGCCSSAMAEALMATCAMHVYIEDIGRHEGEEVTIKGWLHNRRSSGKIHFLILRDGTGFIQAVMSKAAVGDEMFKAADHLSQETSVIVTGTARADTRAPSGYEIDVKSLEVVGESHDYPITPKEHGVDYLLDRRHLWIRSERQQAILRDPPRDHQRGPRLLQRARLHPRRHADLHAGGLRGHDDAVSGAVLRGQTAYLTQSGQLYNEANAMALGRVYCFGPTFRAEKSKTRRHLTEFWMVEPEMAYADLDDVMELAEDLVVSVVARVLDEAPPRADGPRARHHEARGGPEAVSAHLVRRGGQRRCRRKGLPIEWGGDFGGPDETALSEQFDRPVMVHRYPSAIKAFYMKPDPERAELALGVDVLAPEGYGEIIGGGERLADLDLLLQRIKEHNLPQEAFEWYLDLRRYGTVPHGGFGMGIERVVAWICKLEHVRETIPYPRMLYRLYP